MTSPLLRDNYMILPAMHPGVFTKVKEITHANA
jgi:hypothetical protein